MSQQFPPFQPSDEAMQTPYPYSSYQTPLYPPSQPQPKRQSFLKSLWLWLWIGVVIIVFFGGFGLGRVSTSTSSLSTPSMTLLTPSTSSTSSTSTSLSPTQSATTSAGTASSDHHKINETVSVDGIWQVTVTKVYTSQGDEFTVPKQGNTFLQIDVSLKNVSSIQRFAYESLFNLRDASGQKYELTFLGNTQLPDGQISAGDPLKGTLTYEVPASTKSFVLSFSATFESQQVSWNVSV